LEPSEEHGDNTVGAYDAEPEDKVRTRLTSWYQEEEPLLNGNVLHFTFQLFLYMCINKPGNTFYSEYQKLSDDRLVSITRLGKRKIITSLQHIQTN
jgi:hypothetical protein